LKLQRVFNIKTPIHGLVLIKQTQQQQVAGLELVAPMEGLDKLGVADHTLKFHCTYSIPPHLTSNITLSSLYQSLSQWIQVAPVVLSRDVRSILVQSVTLALKDPTTLTISWAFQDEDLAIHCINIIKKKLEEPPQQET